MSCYLECDGCGVGAYHGQVPKRWKCRRCGRKHKFTREQRSDLLRYGSFALARAFSPAPMPEEGHR